MGTVTQPLAGVRVLELANGVAGPYAGKLLADYGADVVKAEPPLGDPARRHVVVPGDRPDPEQGPLHLHLNANKRSVVLDAFTPEGRERVEELVRWADVVIESYEPGTFDVHAARAANPRVVVVSVTGFGQDGPYAHLRGDEIAYYAMGGPMHATGVAEREPVKLGGNLIQYQCGNVAALAALGALTIAERSGTGIHVDVANFETQAGSMDRRATFLVQYAYNGTVMGRESVEARPALPTGLYPTLDGHVQIGTPPIWVPRMLDVLDSDELRELFKDPAWIANPDLGGAIDAVLYPWLLGRTKVQAMEDAQRATWPMTAVRAPVELLDDDHYAARGFFVDVEHPVAGRFKALGPQVRLDGGWAMRRPAPLLGEHDAEVDAEVAAAPPRPAVVAAAPRLPLEGVRVIDITVVWAGPYCTMQLQDLGAEVIRVDNPYIFPNNTRGAVVRPNAAQRQALSWLNAYPDDEPGERPWNRTALFNNHCRGKRSATADLRRPLAKEAFLRLVERCDVLVENNSVGVLPKLGLGWEELHARNPRLVMVRLPAMGLTGPKSAYLGYGTHFEALCGFTAIRGYADFDPATVRPTYHMDPASGTTGAIATLLALRRREQTGVGELVEMAQAENMLHHIGEYLVDASLTGREHGPLGNRHPSRAPQGCYPCAGDDRWVVVSVGADEEWAALRRAMGDPAWAIDHRFATLDGRWEHHDEIDAHIGAWTAGLDRHDVFRRCQAEGVTAAPVLDEADLLADEHLRARRWFRRNSSADAGEHEYPGHLWRWDGPALAWGPLCVMGADNEHVWKGIAGLTDAEYAALGDEGDLATGYLGPDGQLL